jgi:hypothetical protein
LRATYYISFNNWSTQTQIYPSVAPKIKVANETGEKFKRARVDSFVITGTKNASVYTSLLTYFTTPDFNTEICYKIVSDVTYLFKASISDGELDTEKKVYKIAPEPDDIYRPFIDKYKKKIKIGALTGADYYPLKKNTGTFVNDGFDTFAEVANHITIIEGGGGSTSYIRNPVTAGATATGMRVRLNIGNISTNDQITLRLVDSLGNALSADQVTMSNGYYILEYTGAVAVLDCFVEIQGEPGINCQFDYAIYFLDQSLNFKSETLEFFIGNMLTSLAITATVTSTYLWNDACSSDCPAPIVSYIGSNPANDYVVEGAAIWNDISVIRVSRLINGNSDINISLEDLMNILKFKLRAWWYIDADGLFRIEHEKYFRSFTSQIDLTGATYSSYKPEIDRKNYVFNKSDIYSQLNYKENNEGNSPFVAYAINYISILTTFKSKDINVDITCDIQNAYDNSSSANSGGLALVHGTVNSGEFEQGMVTTSAGVWYTNYYLSWEYLFANYWGYFGEADEADINNGTTLTLDGVKEFLEQDEVKFFYAGSLDWKRPVTLSHGTGWLRSWEHDPETGFYSINVGFNPYL